MLIHIILLAFILFIGNVVNFNVPQQRKAFIFWVSVSLVLISGLRNIYIGPDDTYGYYREFLDYKLMSYDNILISYKDPIFGVFSKIIGELTNYNFTFYLIIIGVIFVCPIGYFINKYSPFPLLSIILLLSLGIFDAQMVIIRQSAAIAISSYSYIFLKDKRYVSAVLSVLVAACFHLTAILLLFTGFIVVKKINKVTVCIYLLIILFFLMFSATIADGLKAYMILTDRLSAYGNAERTLSISGFVQLLFIACYVFKNYKITINKYPDAVIGINMLMLAILFQSMASISAEFFRVAWYFKFFLILLIPQVLKATGSPLAKNILYILFVVYYIYSIRDIDYAFFWETYRPKFELW